MIWIILVLMTAAAVMAVLWPLSRHRAAAPPDRSGHAVLSRPDRRDRARPGARASCRPRGRGREGRSRPPASARDRHAGASYARLGRARSSPPPRCLDPGSLGCSDPGAGDLWRLWFTASARRSRSRRGCSRSRRQDRPRGRDRPDRGAPRRRTRRTGAAGRSSLRSISAWAAGRTPSRHTSSALRYLGPDADRLANYGEALVLAKDGVVSAEAQDGLRARPSKLDAGSAKARFYLARAAEQDGRPTRRRQAYTQLLLTRRAMPPGCRSVREQLARLDGKLPAAAPRHAIGEAIARHGRRALRAGSRARAEPPTNGRG